MELASSLADSSDRLLAKLELPERVLLLIQEARRIQVSAARNRALRRVRIALRDADATSIRERLSDLRNPAHDGTAGAVLDRWRERLVSGGQVAVAEFLNAFPGANRRQLEQRLRNVRKATESTRAQRLRSLNKALRDAIACRASISRFGVAEIG